MALLLFYLWLIKDVAEKGLRRIIYVVMGLNAALCLVAVLVSIFRCRYVRVSINLYEHGIDSLQTYTCGLDVYRR